MFLTIGLVIGFIIGWYVNEKFEDIFEAVENTMVILFQKDFGEHAQISVTIDRNNGSMTAKQTWEIIDDQEYLDSEFKDAYIALKVAKNLDEHSEIGGVIEEALDVENGSRIGAHNFKQTLLRLLRDIDRDKTAKRFEDRMGDLITGEVKRLLKDFLILELQDGTYGGAFEQATGRLKDDRVFYRPCRCDRKREVHKTFESARQSPRRIDRRDTHDRQIVTLGDVHAARATNIGIG